MPIQLFRACLATLLTAFVCALPAIAQETDQAQGGARVEAISIEAEVVSIDHDTRELSIRSPLGDIITVTAGDHIERLHEIAVGDLIVISYLASLEGELRQPTAAEIAEPWVEVDAAAVAGADMLPGAIAGNVVRAVCTIEGMNRLTRTVTVLDPRGKYHVIGDVEPEKMEGVTLGTTLVLTYTQAMAITLEEKPRSE
jgi:hypothetical protein